MTDPRQLSEERLAAIAENNTHVLHDIGYIKNPDVPALLAHIAFQAEQLAAASEREAGLRKLSRQFVALWTAFDQSDEWFARRDALATQILQWPDASPADRAEG